MACTAREKREKQFGRHIAHGRGPGVYIFVSISHKQARHDIIPRQTLKEFEYDPLASVDRTIILLSIRILLYSYITELHKELHTICR